MIDAALEIEICRLLANCPLGTYKGRVVRHRSLTDAELVAWIDRVYEMKDRLHRLHESTHESTHVNIE
jgi:hypothetical protein